MITNYAQKVLDVLNEESSDLDPELAKLYALLVMVLGHNVNLEDVHDAWAIWRNASNPSHKSLIPFGDLAPEVRELDREYRDAIVRTARRMTA